MASDDLKRLRDEVKRRQRAASAKVSRLRAKNVEISGSQFDVRRDPSKITRYNRPQLESYLSQLNTFTSRSNQFVAGSGGAPIRASKWREFQAEQRKFNAKVQRAYEPIKDLGNPAAGMSIVQYDETIRPNRVAAAGRASHRPMSPRDVQVHRVPDEKALDILTRDMRRRNRREYMPEELSKQRKQLKQMLNTIGVPEYLDLAGKLTDDQFDVIFNYMQFAEDVSLRYTMMQTQSRSIKDQTYESVLEDNASGIKDWLQFGLSLPKRRSRGK